MNAIELLLNSYLQKSYRWHTMHPLLKGLGIFPVSLNNLPLIFLVESSHAHLCTKYACKPGVISVATTAIHEDYMIDYNFCLLCLKVIILVQKD